MKAFGPAWRGWHAHGAVAVGMVLSCATSMPTRTAAWACRPVALAVLILAWTSLHAADALRPGDVLTNSIGMKLAYIPAGEFDSGLNEIVFAIADPPACGFALEKVDFDDQATR